jgi:hypothetical protein
VYDVGVCVNDVGVCVREVWVGVGVGLVVRVCSMYVCLLCVCV